MLEYEATGHLLSGKWTFHICHTGPLNRGVEIWHFFTLWIGISASNLNWILARGPAAKICWEFCRLHQL